MTLFKTLLTASFLTALMGCSAQISNEPAELTLQKVVAGEHRSNKNKARDVYRNPVETLSFLGFQPNMTVVELWPGGGWYMEILAPALKDSGQYYGAHFPDTGKDDYFTKSRHKIEQKIAENDIYSGVILTDFIARQENQIAPEGTADMVLTFRNLHNWKEDGVLQMYKDAYKALKPGGVMGVVEHRLPTSLKWENNMQSGYFPQALAIELAEQAGFKLVGMSDVNANAKDTAKHPRGVWTLPPVLRLGEKDKEKYLAIGESDRMTLKFIKP